MHATHCLIGCMIGSALCLVSIDAAATNGMEAPGMTGSATTAIGAESPHDGLLATASDSASSSNDARDARSAGSDSAGSSATNASNGSPTSTVPGPRREHVHHVGWQSLLPGSIQ